MAAPTSIATRLFKLANGGPSTHGSLMPLICSAVSGSKGWHDWYHSDSKQLILMAAVVSTAGIALIGLFSVRRAQFRRGEDDA
jgi:hypothetical protein